MLYETGVAFSTVGCRPRMVVAGPMRPAQRCPASGNREPWWSSLTLRADLHPAAWRPHFALCSNLAHSQTNGMVFDKSLVYEAIAQACSEIWESYDLTGPPGSTW